MDIQFSGKLSKQEFRKAIALHYNLSGWIRYLLGGFAFLYAAGAIFLIFRNPSMISTYLPGIAFILGAFSFPFWLPAIQSASYDQPGNAFREGLQGTISEGGIAIQAPTGNSNTYWNAYTGFKQTRKMIMLYQNKNCFNIFTPAMFSSIEDWNLFCTEISRRLKKK